MGVVHRISDSGESVSAAPVVQDPDGKRVSYATAIHARILRSRQDTLEASAPLTMQERQELTVLALCAALGEKPE